MSDPSTNTIASTIQLRALDAADSIAFLGVGSESRPFTYQHLQRQVETVVQRLNNIGIGRNDRVAIVLPNGMELAVAFLAVAAAATSAPLNPAYTRDEFDFYLSDLDAKALLLLAGSDSPAREVALKRNVPVIELIPTPDDPHLLFKVSALSGSPAAAGGYALSGDTALVLHTSGTTSRPKMVPLSHANLLASARNILQTLELSPSDRCLNVMPLFHIHGLVGVVLSSIIAGASVVCTPGFAADRFFSWLQETQASWYSAVPTMHQAILAQAAKSATGHPAKPLRFVRSSSAALPVKVMAELESLFMAPVIEAYGMTEASHQMASNPLPPSLRKPGSVGKATGQEIAILDAAGKLLETGQVGEIVLRGPNVTHGYANNPEANRKAFTDGWFRTGDEGYLDSDGYLFLTGRLKEMINRGGEKVAPRQVDEVFMDHPAVMQAVAFAVPHPTLGEDLAVAVVLKSGATATAKELRQYALARLALHKAPSQVFIVEHIPRGATGKLQRIGLAEKILPLVRPTFIPPSTLAEQALANLWKEVLHIDALGIWDNFFAAGGDSLTAVQLIARIRIVFEVDMPLGSIFQEPTIAEQATRIEGLLLDDLSA